MAEDSSSEPEKGRTSSQSSLYAARPLPSPAARPDCLPRFAILTTLNLRKITFQAPSGCASNNYSFAAIKTHHCRHVPLLLMCFTITDL